MARIIVVSIDGEPNRAFYSEAEAQDHARKWLDGMKVPTVRPTLWDVPVGRSVGATERVGGES